MLKERRDLVNPDDFAFPLGGERDVPAAGSNIQHSAVGLSLGGFTELLGLIEKPGRNT
jgi:hypothetical protein